MQIKDMKYIKCFLSILILLQLSSCNDKMEISDSQANSFIKFYGGGGKDIGNDVKQTSDGGYAFVGTITDSVGVRQAAFYKTDKFGNIEWKLITEGSNDKMGNSFIIDNEGNYVIVGTTTIEENNTDVFLMKVSSTGDSLWSYNYGGQYNQEGNSLVQKDNNELYIVGNTVIDEINTNRMLLYLINSDGDSLGNNIKRGNSGNSIYQINSSLYIISGVADNKFSLFILEEGTSIMANKLDYLENDSKALEVYPTYDGNLIVIGTVLNGNNYDIFLTKIKDDLSEADEWSGGRFFGGSAQESGNSVKVTENNEIIIFGTTNSFGEGGNDMYLIKTDSEGNEIFTKTFGGAGDENGSKIALTSDGGFIMIGSSEFEGNSMICLIKTDSEGNIGK